MMPSSRIVNVKQHKKETVCFSLKNDVFIIERYDDMILNDEKANLWYMVRHYALFLYTKSNSMSYASFL